MSHRLLAASAVGLAVLTGCGGGSQPAAPATTTLDPAASAAQDTAFATAMFDHRHASLQLAGLAAQHAERPGVLDLARTLLTAHDEEMGSLEEMLAGWGAPVPHVEGHTDLGDEIPGLLDKDGLAQLRAAAPSAFETRFLTVLKGHLEAAKPLAEKELRLGSDPQATAYARTVLDELPGQLATIDALAKGAA